MQQVFKNAFLFREPTVLKRRLLPLCCGHVMILMAADSPYAVPRKEPANLIDLAFAVGICSRTFEDAEAWMKSETLLDDVHTWGKSCRKLDRTKEAAIFNKYLQDYSEFPKRWTKEQNPAGSQHPWPLLTAVAIMPWVGESRAWNMPLPKATSLWSAYQETQGDTNLKQDWEIEALEKMRAEAAKKARSQNEK